MYVMYNAMSSWLNQCCHNAWTWWAVARGPTSIGAHANLCMLCMACILMLKH